MIIVMKTMMMMIGRLELTERRRRRKNLPEKEQRGRSVPFHFHDNDKDDDNDGQNHASDDNDGGDHDDYDHDGGDHDDSDGQINSILLLNSCFLLTIYTWMSSLHGPSDRKCGKIKHGWTVFDKIVG